MGSLVILILRTYALYACNKKLLWALTLLVLVRLAPVSDGTSGLTLVWIGSCCCGDRHSTDLSWFPQRWALGRDESEMHCVTSSGRGPSPSSWVLPRRGQFNIVCGFCADNVL